MKPALSFVVVGLVACSSGREPVTDAPPPPPTTSVPEDTGSEPPVDTGTGPVVDPNGPITDTCPEASAAFAALQVADARTAYEACIAADADNAGAYVGLAVAELALLPDRAAFTDALARCGQTNHLVESLYGPDGQLASLGARFAGASTVGVEFVDNDGREPLDGFDDPRLVVAEIREVSTPADRPGDSDSGAPPAELRRQLQVSVASSVTYRHEIRLHLDVDDVYGDSTGVALAPGLLVDVANLPEGSFEVATACGEPGSACNGWLLSNYPAEGAVEVVEFGLDEGDPVELVVDARLPATCADDACIDRYALAGTLSDTISGDVDVSWVPFAGSSTICDDRNCDRRTSAYTIAADWCSFEDHLTINQLAQDVADELEAVGDTFATAAEKAGRHEVRFDGVFAIGGPLPFNRGEMEALAGALHAAAAAARLASSYDVLDPTAVPAELTVDYAGLGDEDGECVDVDYYGLSVREAGDQLAEHFLDVSSVQDLAGAREGLLQAVRELRDAVASTSRETELYDFAFASAWAIDLLTDLNVVVRSLEGNDGELVTAEGWRVTLDQFFDHPTDRARLLSVADPDLAWSVQTLECSDEIVLDAGVEDWLVENGGGALQIPQTAREGDGPWPVLLDPDRYEELEDPATNDPRVLEEPLLEILR